MRGVARQRKEGECECGGFKEMKNDRKRKKIAGEGEREYRWRE